MPIPSKMPSSTRAANNRMNTAQPEASPIAGPVCAVFTNCKCAGEIHSVLVACGVAAIKHLRRLFAIGAYQAGWLALDHQLGDLSSEREYYCL